MNSRPDVVTYFNGSDALGDPQIALGSQSYALAFHQAMSD
jgi:hypothetical protein